MGVIVCINDDFFHLLPFKILEGYRLGGKFRLC
jgi:hypothetical protein